MRGQDFSLSLKWSELVKVSGQEFIFRCPRCHETKGHLYVNFSKGVFICFRCGWSGVVQGFAHKPPSLPADNGELLKEVTKPNSVKSLEGLTLQEAIQLVPKALRKVVLDHGVKFSTLQRFQVGVDPFHERLWFPVYWGFSLVGYQWRTCGEIKYLSYGPLKKCFFGVLNPLSSKEVVLVEGVFDAMKVFQATGLTAVASFGKSLSRFQKLMLSGCRRVYVGWDEDALPEIWRFVRLPDSVEVLIVRWEAKDPCELTDDEVRERIQSAVPMYRFFANLPTKATEAQCQN